MVKHPAAGDIKRGDIVVFNFSHIGLAVGGIDRGYIPTVEGNSNPRGSREGGGVYRLNRPIGKIRSRIRLELA